MSRLPLFDSYSGDHVDEVLRQIEDRNLGEMHKEADSEFLRGERSAVAEIRQILAASTYSPLGLSKSAPARSADPTVERGRIGFSERSRTG